MENETGREIKIVLIENDMAAVEAIKEVLTKFWKEFRVNLIMNVNQALEFLQQKNTYHRLPLPDLVVFDTDLFADRKNLLDDINWDKGLRLIPFVVLAGSNDHEAGKTLPVPVYRTEKPLTYEKLSQLFGTFLLRGLTDNSHR